MGHSKLDSSFKGVQIRADNAQPSSVVFVLKPTQFAAVGNILLILRSKMVRVSNPRLVELVLRLHSILKSGQKVSEELKKSPFSISRSGVYYILRKQIMDEKSPAKPVKRLSTAGKPKVQYVHRKSLNR